MSKLYNTEKEADRSYIPWLFAWASPKVQGADLPILRAALEREGWWDKTVQQSNAARPGLHERILGDKAKVDALVAQGVNVHKDVVKMRKLQVEKVLRDQKELQPIPDSQFVLARRPFRRSHHSVALLQNSHCRYCGEVGHRADGCLKAREAAWETDTVVVADAPPLTGNDKALAK